MDLAVGFFRSAAGLQHSAHGLSQPNPLMRVRRESTDQHLSIDLRRIKRDLKSWCNRSSADLFFCIVICIRVKQMIVKKKNVGRGLVLSVGCWLDGGGSECELKIGFTQTKWLENSGTRHQREIYHFYWKILLCQLWNWLKITNLIFTIRSITCTYKIPKVFCISCWV